MPIDRTKLWVITRDGLAYDFDWITQRLLDSAPIVDVDAAVQQYAEHGEPLELQPLTQETLAEKKSNELAVLYPIHLTPVDRQAIVARYELLLRSSPELRLFSIDWFDPMELFVNIEVFVAAAKTGNLSLIAPFLDEQRVRVNDLSKDGFTALYLAAAYGHMDVFNALIAAGANINMPDTRGITPAFIAASTGQVEILRKMHALGVDLNVPDMHGVTPAYVAVAFNQSPVLQLFSDLDVRLDAPDLDGTTPLDVAEKNGAVAVYDELKRLLGLTEATVSHAGLFSDNGAKRTFESVEPGSADVHRQVFSKLQGMIPDLNRIEAADVPSCVPKCI